MELDIEKVASSADEIQKLVNEDIVGTFAKIGNVLGNLEESEPVEQLFEALKKMESVYNNEIRKPINTHLSLERQQIPELDEYIKKIQVNQVKSRKASNKKYGIDLSAFK